VNVREYGTHTVLWPADVHELGSAIISPRKLQYVRVGFENGPALTVVNYHGMWRDTGKLDTPERIIEMQTLAGFVRKFGGPLVLCGDFNLEPNTRALSSLARIAKLTPLVGVGHEGTRTPLYRHHHDPNYSKHADNIYLSHDIKSYEFGVMQDVVSDHAALRLTLGWMP
jgi:endonuclease/exonuclease/phosphatase family metal-dependent hydrolase